MNAKRIIGAGLVLPLVASVGLILGSPAYADHDEGPRIEKVNCDDGKSINKKIAKAPLDQKLIIEVKGNCVENVVIDRDWVTLQPHDSGGSIEAAESDDPFPWAVAVFGATNVIIQDFDSIDGAGGTFAILISNGSAATVRNNTIHGASFQGLGIFGNSFARVEDNWIHDNNQGIGVQESSSAVIRRNTITNNNTIGVVVIDLSFVNSGDNDVNGNSSFGVLVEEGSAIALRGGDTITGNGTGVRVAWNSVAFFRPVQTTINGNSNYGIVCDKNSSMQLNAVDFTGPANVPGNILNSGCTL